MDITRRLTALLFILLMIPGSIAAQNQISLTGQFASGPAQSVAANGDMAYVVSGSQLTTFSLANPAEPDTLNNLKLNDPPEEMLIHGDYLYGISQLEGKLQVFDITSSESPSLVTESSIDDIYIEYNVDRFAASGNHLIVNSDDGGILFYDISDPANPTLSTTYTEDYFDNVTPYGIEAQSDRLYIALQDSGLRVVDISDPTNASEIGSIALDNLEAEAINVSDTVAYLRFQNQSYEPDSNFVTVNIKDPSNPSIISTYDVEADRMIVEDTLAHIIDISSTDKHHILDVSDPATITEVEQYSAAERSSDFAVQGSIFIFPNGANGTHIFEYDSPNTPELQSTIPAVPKPEDILYDGNTAYLPGGEWPVTILDMSDPSNPVKMGSYEQTDESHGGFVDDTLLYLADDFNGFDIINIKDPNNLKLVTEYREDLIESWDITVNDTIAYVFSEGVNLMDVSDPTNPTPITKIDIHPNDLRFQGDYGYANTYEGFHIVDLSDPTSPSIRSSFSDVYGDTYSLAVSDTLVFVANDKNIFSVNINDKDNPERIDRYGADNVSDMEIVGNYLFARSEEALLILDTREADDLGHNGLVAEYPLPTNGELWTDGEQVITTAGKYGVFVFTADLATSVDELATTPQKMRLLDNYPNPFNPATDILFELDKTRNVTIEVFDILGRKVATLLDDQKISAGQHQVNFDASQLSSGVYIYRLQSSNFSQTQTMTLIK